MKLTTELPSASRERPVERGTETIAFRDGSDAAKELKSSRDPKEEQRGSRNTTFLWLPRPLPWRRGPPLLLNSPLRLHFFIDFRRMGSVPEGSKICPFPIGDVISRDFFKALPINVCPSNFLKVSRTKRRNCKMMWTSVADSGTVRRFSREKYQKKNIQNFRATVWFSAALRNEEKDFSLSEGKKCIFIPGVELRSQECVSVGIRANFPFRECKSDFLYQSWKRSRFIGSLPKILRSKRLNVRFYLFRSCFYFWMSDLNLIWNL